MRSPTKYSWKDIQGMTDKELMSAYRRRSREARDAYRSMQEAIPDLAELKSHTGDFRTLESIKDLTRDKLEKEMLKTENYLNSSYSDIDRYEKMKAESLKTLEKNKFSGIDEDNFVAFSNYMAELDKQGLLSQATSSWYAEQFENVNSNKISQKVTEVLKDKTVTEEMLQANLEHWAKHAQEGKRLYFSKKRKRSGSEEYKK